MMRGIDGGNMFKTNPKIYNTVEYSFYRHFIMMFSILLIILTLIYASLLTMSYSVILFIIALVNCLAFLFLDLYYIVKMIILLTCYNNFIYMEIDTTDMVITHPNSTYTAIWVFVGDDRYTSDKVIKLHKFARLVKNDMIRVGLNDKNQKCIIFID